MIFFTRHCGECICEIRIGRAAGQRGTGNSACQGLSAGLRQSQFHLHEHVVFLIVGGGPDEKALKQLALEKGVMSRVRFLGEISGGIAYE